MNKKLFLKSSILLVLILTIFIGNLMAQDIDESKIKLINTQKANELIDENKNNQDFVILDVRTSEEFNSSHIASAENIDYKSANFKEEISKLDKNKTYLTYCRSGRRSTAASEIMVDMGFKNIYMIDGGIIAWQKSDLPTEK